MGTFKRIWQKISEDYVNVSYMFHGIILVKHIVNYKKYSKMFHKSI